MFIIHFLTQIVKNIYNKISNCLNKCFNRNTNTNTNTDTDINSDENKINKNYKSPNKLKPNQQIINSHTNCEICSDQLFSKDSIIIFNKQHYVHKFCYKKYKMHKKLLNKEETYNMFDYKENRDSNETIDEIKLNDIECGLDYYNKFNFNEKEAIFINRTLDKCIFCLDKKLNGMPLLLHKCNHSLHLECNDIYIKKTTNNITCLECNV